MAPLDKATKPVPPPPPPPPQVGLLAVRPNLVMVPRSDDVAAPVDDRLPGLRTSGILWGPTVRAILEVEGQSPKVVRPGDTVDVASAGGTQLTVVSIGPEGVRLRNENTGRVYFAPLQRG